MSEKLLDDVEEIIALLRASGVRKFDYCSSQVTLQLDLAYSVVSDVPFDAPSEVENTTLISSPGIGYVHFIQPGTDSPFVELGTAVTKGQTIAIVAFESVFLSVKSPIAGKIVDLHALNGQRVGYGDTIATVKS